MTKNAKTRKNSDGINNFAELAIHIRKTFNKNQASNYCIRELLRSLVNKSGKQFNSGKKMKGCTYVSINAEKEFQANRKSTNLIADHAIPISLFIKKFDKIPTDKMISVSALIELSKKYSIMVLITKDEDNELNKNNLRKLMPSNWDGSDEFARYKHANIKIKKLEESDLKHEKTCAP